MRTIAIIIGLALTTTAAAQVGINTTTPDPAAALEINAQIPTVGFGGLRIPSVTEAQLALITTSASSDGTLIFVERASQRCLEIYDGAQGSWQQIQCLGLPPATLYSEDFQSYTTGSGITGTGNVGDYPAGVSNWDLDVSNAGLADTSDYVTVNAAGELEVHDSNGPVFFSTPVINATGYSQVTVTADFTEQGDLEYEEIEHTDDLNCGGIMSGNDFIDIEYSADGGMTWTEFPNYLGAGTANHTIASEFTAINFTASLPATSLILRFRIQNYASGEYIRVDNILVTAQ